MDLISNFVKSAQPKPSSDQPTNAEHHDKPASSSDLFSSAKIVSDAAQAQFRNEPDKYDKNKAAAAAADLLDAASDYGKLDETKGVGKYVDQAEGYLRQYSTPASGGQKTAAAEDHGEGKPVEKSTTATETTDAEKPSVGGGAGDYVKKAEELLDKKPDGGAEAGGAGDYIKKAEEFLNKPSGDSGGESESTPQSGGGYGDLLKAAGGFLNK